MNRIILVGNGFDLAHGLESSYNDFVLDLFKQKITQAVEEGAKNNFSSHKQGYYYEDILLSLYIPNFSDIQTFRESILSIKKIDKLKEFTSNGSVELKIKSQILKNYFENWSDFEKSFFECLVRTYRNKGNIHELNNEFSLIRKHLKDYIFKVQINIEDSDINVNRIDKLIKIFSEGDLKEVLFLSFNYTRTLGYYFNEVSKTLKSNIIYLHGNVNDIEEEDELIFGYDNDLDDNYISIISDSKIEYIDFFKSVLYTNTTSKRELINFLGNDNFEVFTFGHSFEVSDFTILREIFLHTNCNKIKVYFHPELKSKDYNKKRKLLRLMLRDSIGDFSKLVERNQSEPMPILISKYKDIS